MNIGFSSFWYKTARPIDCKSVAIIFSSKLSMHPCSPLLLIISKYLQIRKILSSIISFYSVCKKELFLVGLLSCLLFLTIQLYPSSSITNSIIPSQINLQIVNLSSGRIHLAPVSLVECTLNYSELFTRYGWEEERI